MASNVSTIDGLGFEEVNQENNTELISGTNIYGSVGSFTNINVTTIFGNVISGTNIASNTIKNASGLIYSTSLNSLFGARVQAGSCITTSAGLGSAIFATAFSNTNYAVNCMMGSAIIANLGSTYGISGLKSLSGCTFWGPASMPTDWIAVGL
jgi:hypothetical protein